MSLYTTTALIGALGAMDRPKAFLRDNFFSKTVTSDSEEVAIDKLLKRRKMAPFVSPDVPAKERAQRGRTVETFVPATVKPLNTIHPKQLLKRAHGEEFGGILTPEQRRILTINQTLLDQDDEITRREEWMCSEEIKTGRIKVEGEDYETQIVDFQRPANQTVALTGVNRWGETGVDILDYIQLWGSITQKASGAVVKPVILGSGAARLFQKDDGLREILDNRRQDGGNMQLGPVPVGGEEQPFAYLGSIGQLDFWTYSQFFEDDAGNEIEVWPEYGCGLIAPAAFDGMMAYGAILDMEHLAPVSRLPKNFKTENPSREHLTTESAPLPVASDISGSFFALVR